MEKLNTATYDRRYANGDFPYNPKKEREWLEQNLIERYKLSPRDRVLDLGCGKGLHSSLLADAGLRVFGIEPSIEGVKGALERRSEAVFINASASKLGRYFDQGDFDLIYCRGMSWFHRELDRVCPSTGVNVAEMMPYFMEFLRPGGVFVLQIATDFTGDTMEDGVIYNRLSAYVDLFKPHGEIITLANWKGEDLFDDEQARQVGRGIVIAIRTPDV